MSDQAKRDHCAILFILIMIEKYCLINLVYMTTVNPESLPFNLREKLGLKDASCLKTLGNVATKQKTPFGEIYENLPNNFSQVHSTGHLLKPVCTK